MFQSATIKLTMWYLALMMGLSLGFSVVLYNISIDSLRAGFENQRSAIRDQYRAYYGIQLSPSIIDALQGTEIASATQRLLANLTLANTAVLVVGGVASFYMARRTLRPIEQTMELQARFTADASHELRTPLTAMQAEIEVALRDPKLPVAEARELLASNLEEVRRLQGLSNSLLALSSHDQQHFAPSSQALGPIIETAIKRTATMAQQKQVKLDNHVKNMDVMGSTDGLIQLFSILFDNAVKYSPPQTAITLRSSAKGQYARISVADQGYGISATDLPHIFDRLYRADNARSKGDQGGFGLGLSIAKKIVELHKGSIDVISKSGKGSVFTVRLPLASRSGKKRRRSKAPEASR